MGSGYFKTRFKCRPIYILSTNGSRIQVSILSLLDFFVYNTVVGSDNPHQMNASLQYLDLKQHLCQ